MCHGVVPVWCRFISVLPGMTTVLPGVATVCPGLLGLHVVLIHVFHQGGVIRIGWFQSVPGMRDYLKLCHESTSLRLHI